MRPTPSITKDELDHRVEHFVTACREAGLKLTHQRLEIFREVAKTTAHPDAEAVHQGVRARLPTVSLDTVYRTLWTLTEVGLLHTLGPRRDSTRFDGNLAPHHHFVCTACDAAYDFEAPALHQLEVPREARSFGEVRTSHVEFTGLCRRCAAAGAHVTSNTAAVSPAASKTRKSRVHKTPRSESDGESRRKRTT